MLFPVIHSITEKGQLVIPAKMRKLLEIHSGTKVMVEYSPKAKAVLIKPVENPIKSLRGLSRGQFKKTAAQIKNDLRNEDLSYEQKKK